MRTIRILIADDHAPTRGALRDIIDAEPDMEVVGQAADGEQAVQLALALGPDLVIMDIHMPHVDGLEATRRIVASGLPCRVLMVTGEELGPYRCQAREAGAAGLVVKATPISQLLEAVRSTVKGEKCL